MTLLAHASKLMSPSLPVPAAWYAIPLRLVVGFGFMQHGYAKLARGPEDFINILHALGVPMAFLLGWATIIVELVGGLFILLGAFVPLAAIPMIVVLLVAIFSVHLPNGFSSIKLESFDAAGAHFDTLDSQDMKRTLSISRHLSRCVWAVPDQFQSMDT
jgi:putative oxidoreductase